MARPERNDVDYFPHEVNHGRKMHIIESKYGNDGYSVWFKLLEQLGKASHHYIDVRDEANFMYLESIFKTDKTEAILNDLSKLGAIDSFLWNKRIIWSQKFVDSIQDAYRNRNNNLQDYTGLLHHLRIKVRQKLTRAGVNTPQKPTKDRIGYKRKEKDRIDGAPELSEFLDYAKDLCIETKKDWEHWEFTFTSKYQFWFENKWKDGNGKKIVNWKTKLRNTLPYLKPIYGTKQKAGFDYERYT